MIYMLFLSLHIILLLLIVIFQILKTFFFFFGWGGTGNNKPYCILSWVSDGHKVKIFDCPKFLFFYYLKNNEFTSLTKYFTSCYLRGWKIFLFSFFFGKSAVVFWKSYLYLSFIVTNFSEPLRPSPVDTLTCKYLW